MVILAAVGAFTVNNNLVVAAGIFAYLTPLFGWGMKNLRSVRVNPA